MGPLVALLGAGSLLGLGLWVANRSKKPSRKPTPANVTTTTTNNATGAQQIQTASVSGMWDFWNSLPAAAQDQYRHSLWTWIAAGNWGGGMESATRAGITSESALMDGANLSFATDAYQTAHGGLGVAAGQIDPTVYASVVSGQ